MTAMMIIMICSLKGLNDAAKGTAEGYLLRSSRHIVNSKLFQTNQGLIRAATLDNHLFLADSRKEYG